MAAFRGSGVWVGDYGEVDPEKHPVYCSTCGRVKPVARLCAMEDDSILRCLWCGTAVLDAVSLTPWQKFKLWMIRIVY